MTLSKKVINSIARAKRARRNFISHIDEINALIDSAKKTGSVARLDDFIQLLRDEKKQHNKSIC